MPAWGVIGTVPDDTDKKKTAPSLCWEISLSKVA